MKTYYEQKLISKWHCIMKSSRFASNKFKMLHYTPKKNGCRRFYLLNMESIWYTWHFIKNEFQFQHTHTQQTVAKETKKYLLRWNSHVSCAIAFSSVFNQNPGVCIRWRNLICEVWIAFNYCALSFYFHKVINMLRFYAKSITFMTYKSTSWWLLSMRPYALCWITNHFLCILHTKIECIRVIHFLSSCHFLRILPCFLRNWKGVYNGDDVKSEQKKNSW